MWAGRSALYPLSVIKTRLMVLPGETQGVSGAVQVTKQVLAESGVAGLYRCVHDDALPLGFGTGL
jgi:hypothetical protein